MSNFNVNTPPGGPYSPSTIIGWLVQAVQTLWRRVNGVSTSSGGGGSSLTIGDPVTGGTAGAVLFIDSANELASTTALGTSPSQITAIKIDNSGGGGGQSNLLFGQNSAIITEAFGFITISSNEYVSISKLSPIIVQADSLGATTTNGLTIRNTTAATTGHSAVYQSSPALTFLGSIQNGLGAVNGYRLWYDATGGGTLFNIGYTADGSTFSSLVTVNSSGTLAATTFTGAFGGNLTGNVTGSISGGTVAGTTITASTKLVATTGFVCSSILTKGADYLMTTADFTILVDTTAGDVLIELPNPTTCAGQIFNIKKIVAANTLTIDPFTTGNIDGASSKTVTAQWQNTQVQSNGTDYFTL